MSDFSIQPAGHSPAPHASSIRSVPFLTHVSANGVNRARAFDPASSSSVGQSGDRVEISDMARLLAKMRDMPDVRNDRVDQVRSAISRGQYETDQRIDSAIDQMIQEEDLLGG